MRDALLSAMKKELTQQIKATTCACMTIVTVEQGSQAQLAPVTQLTSGEVVKQHTSLFGKLEDAIRQHEHACAEKESLECSLNSKGEENESLKNELKHLKDTAMDESKITITENRISTCEAEMNEL